MTGPFRRGPDETGADRSGADRLSTDQPGADQPDTDQPGQERDSSGRPGSAGPRVALPGAESTGISQDDDTAPGPTEWTGTAPPVGVGPYPLPWPDDPRFDPQLLAAGDTRNVVDAYRYWRREAIVADLDRRRHRLHVAIENFGHDMNIGTVVRTANAFAVAAVHIVGRRRWNRRGAMVTDRYQHIHHHADVGAVLDFARAEGLTVVAVDNVPGSVPLETTTLPVDCLLLFGQESTGLTDDARTHAALTVSIAQFGSTRSINAGVAAGIAMHAWIRQHADLAAAWSPTVPAPGAGVTRDPAMP